MKLFKHLRKRGLALFMALVMCLSLVQVTAFAEENAENLEDQIVVDNQDISSSAEETGNQNFPQTETPAAENPPAENVEDGAADTADQSDTEQAEEPGAGEDSGDETSNGMDPASENESSVEDAGDEISEETAPASEADEAVQAFLSAVYALYALADSADVDAMLAAVANAESLYAVLTDEQKALPAVVQCRTMLDDFRNVTTLEENDETASSNGVTWDAGTETLTLSGQSTETLDADLFAQLTVDEQNVTELSPQHLVIEGFQEIAKIVDLQDMTKAATLESLTIRNVGTIQSQAFKDAGNLNLAVSLENCAVGNSAFYCCNMCKLDLNNVKCGTAQNTAFAGSSVAAVSNKLATIAVTVTDSQLAYGVFQYRKMSTLELNNIKFGQTYFQKVEAEKVIINGCDLSWSDGSNKAFVDFKKISELELINVDVPAKVFSSLNIGIESVKITGGSLGQYAFWKCTMTSLELDGVKQLDQYAFRECQNLSAVTGLDTVGRIDGYAFYGCTKLTGLPVDGTAQMGYNDCYGDVSARVEAILAGKFKLDSAPNIAELSPNTDWDDSKVAKSENWNSCEDGTQLVEQAKWTNPDKTKAQVQVDAYYTAEKQMDFIFVADLSSSMAQLGNANDKNARVYDMQSKLLDMTGQLLNAGDGYDCQVAIVTFGGKFSTNPGSHPVLQFTKDSEVVRTHITGLKPFWESTDYGLGLQEAQELAQTNKNAGRNTAVVFLSDGAPNVNGSGDQYGTTAAAAIKALNVPIYGVLHTPASGYENSARAAMNAVCNEVFVSTDTESFGKAMNDAFTAVYGSHTVTIPVNPAFKDVDILEVSESAGTASYDSGSHTITWTITGMPFTKHTLTYTMDLETENADQKYPVNDPNHAEQGNAWFNNGGASVETPVLSRLVEEPTPDTVTITVQFVDEDNNVVKTEGPVEVEKDSEYDVTGKTTEIPAGYEANGALRGDPATGTADSDKTVIVPVKKEESTPATVTITVKFVDEGGNVVKTDGPDVVNKGDTYDVTAKTNGIPAGYEANGEPYGDPVTGTADDHKTVIVPVKKSSVTPPPITPSTFPSYPNYPSNPGTTIRDEEVPLANTVGLNDAEHFAYIIGYEDDTVRPLNNITRAEAVTIFFRLMTDEHRAANWSTTNSFSDVNVGNWFNNAVSTVQKAGALEHFAQDASFLPNQAITRAEFASIAAGFVSDEITGENVGNFSDTDGHWAAEAIRKAVEAGWINGVGGNRFNPDATITRAEVMTMINRMLDRTPDKDHMLSNMKKWIDNPESAWYYEAVQEATNEHDYERDEMSVETWTELLTVRDWQALETEWANNGGITVSKTDSAERWSSQMPDGI